MKNEQENVSIIDCLALHEAGETQFESLYKQKKMASFLSAKEKLNSKFIKKHNMRAIIFLFHHYGLHKDIKINIKRCEPYQDTISFNFKSEINNKNGIRIFDFFELTKATEIDIQESIVNLFLFLLDKVYRAYDKNKDGFLHEWCESVYWSVDGRDIIFDISEMRFNQSTIKQIALKSLRTYHDLSIKTYYFSWILNKRAQCFFIIMLNEYIQKSNTHKERDNYIYRSIDIITNNIKNDMNENDVTLYIMVIFDLLPIEKNKKEEWLKAIRLKWSEASSIIPIYSWIEKNSNIIDWTQRYITDTVFEKNIPSWMIYLFDWNDFYNKSHSKKKDIILSVLYALSDLSTIVNYKYSFQRLKKSAQKHMERNITPEIKISKLDIRKLDSISELTNEDPEKIISRLIKRELLRLKIYHNR